MRIIFFLTIVTMMACQQVSENKTKETDKEIATRYQVQEGSQFVGYAEKRAWENEQGVLREDYFVYTPTRSLAGHVSWNGDAKKYGNDGSTEILGTFDTSTGISKILNVENAQIYPVQMENIAVAEKKTINIENKGESSESSDESEGLDESEDESEDLDDSEISDEEIPEDTEEESSEEKSSEDFGAFDDENSKKSEDDGELENHADESEAWEEEE